MEYDFIENIDEGRFEAVFSGEHQAFSHWFTEELGPDGQRSKNCLEQLASFQANGVKEVKLEGSEFTLFLESDEVKVVANHMLFSFADDELEEQGLTTDTSNNMSSCGIEDFEQVLKAWIHFTQGQLH